jgi:alanine dehydrogenase
MSYIYIITMKIGVPKEIKDHEYRVALMPVYAGELVNQGHEVWVETQAGEASGFPDLDYRQVGARVTDTPEEIFANCDLVIKVKDPLESECQLLRSGQILFTFLHLAALPEIARLLQESGCTAIAYETVTEGRSLPLLAPMSQIAGRIATQVGAHYLQRSQGGSGTLLGGVPGVDAGRVTIIGGGSVGTNSLMVAVGLGAKVTVLDRSMKRLQELDSIYEGRIQTLHACRHNIEKSVRDSDLVIGAVLVPGASAPKLVTREMLRAMRPGSVVVDVTVDQGGCFETTRPTTHSDPVYVEEGVVHYCVSNMPGIYPHTSTKALNTVTFPYIERLANEGLAALDRDPGFKDGLNVHRGEIVHPALKG